LSFISRLVREHYTEKLVIHQYKARTYLPSILPNTADSRTS